MLYFKITIIMFFSLATAYSSGDLPGPNITDAEASFVIYTFLDKKMLLCECNYIFLACSDRFLYLNLFDEY